MGRPWLRLETAFELLLCAWIAGTKKRPFVWDLMARWAGTYDRAINDFLYDNMDELRIWEPLRTFIGSLAQNDTTCFHFKAIRGRLARAFPMHMLLHSS